MERLPWILLVLSWAFYTMPKERAEALFESVKSNKVPWTLLILTWTSRLVSARWKRKLMLMFGRKVERIHTAKYKPGKVVEKPAETHDVESSPELVAKPTRSERPLREYTKDELMASVKGDAEKVEVPDHKYKDLKASVALFDRILPRNQWEITQTISDVEISSLQLRDLDLPLIRGDGFIKLYTPQEILSVLLSLKNRKDWDPRFDCGEPIEFFPGNDVVTHTVQKGMFPVSARDLVTLVHNTITEERISHIITSVDNDKAPAAGSSGRVRAFIWIAGWNLVKKENGTDCSYLVHVEPNGYIPNSIMKKVQTQTPMCIKGVRNFIESNGFIPFVIQPTSHNVSLEWFECSLVDLNITGKVTKADSTSITMAFGKSFENGIDFTVTGLDVTLVTVPVIKGVCDNAKFVVEMKIGALEQDATVKIKCTIGSNKIITLNGNAI